MTRAAATLVGVLCLIGLARPAAAQEAARCPTELPADAECWSGRDPNGAYYWVARPKNWNGILIMHAHGGPRLAAPKPDSPLEDLTRFAVVLAEGYAWAGSSYRRGGYGVRMALEDTENLRRIFVERFGRPRLTFAHGQSWGGNVVAKLIETHPTAPDGTRAYDGALLTSGVLAGGTRAYDFRADLRAVYEFVCRNHPKPDEPAYPLWMGLPADSKLTVKELEDRVDSCTGVRRKAEERTAEQARNLADITAVIRIPERSLLSHLDWATFLFRDLVHKRNGGLNPFGNAAVRYAGSHDDDALNRGVARFRADPGGVRRLAEDADLTGAVGIPVVTMHAIDDPTAFVEHESVYRDTLAAAGTGDHLVQTFTDEDVHAALERPEYAAVLAALRTWVERGSKPTPESIASSCPSFAARYSGTCRFHPGYQPASFWARTYPRGE